MIFGNSRQSAENLLYLSRDATYYREGKLGLNTINMDLHNSCKVTYESIKDNMNLLSIYLILLGSSSLNIIMNLHKV